MLKEKSTPANAEAGTAGSASTGYPNLIDRICEIAGARPGPEAHERCEMSLDGTLFALMPMPSTRGETTDGLAYFAEVATLPEKDREAVAMRMLEANLFMSSPEAPTFCLNPQTGMAVLSGCLPLDRVTPDSAYDWLKGIAILAEAWRESTFRPTADAPEASSHSKEAPNA